MASATKQRPAREKGGLAGPRFAVENPATGELITKVALLGAKEVSALARQAREAQPGWEALGFEGRGQVLRRAQKWMLDNAERIIGVVVSESGKTHEDAQLVDVGYTVAALGFWAKEAPRYLADERVPAWNNPTTAGKRLIIRYAPIGVVGVIGPWNYPIANSFGDCVPALAAGNSVILKPSEVTPLSSLLMAEMMRECGLPEGVFRVATGDGSTGAALIAEVDCVMFTGSTKTGKGVMKAAAEALVPCYLELGGKDPMIVCADADVERAANAATYYSMNNGGQICISIERVYVEEPVYDHFVAKVTDNVRRLRQGAPTGIGTVDVGAVTFPPQLDIVDSHVRDALERGAKVMVGGHPHSRQGRFFEPTVLVDVDHSMKIMREETFGPTLPIMKVSDVEQAIELANDSTYGLQASVWTSDVARGETLARRIEAGVVCVNDAAVNYTALNLPMGGWKSSGLGSRHGANGIRKYC
ncbi:MAG: aldehyde dehydrogenase family protein, partial [Actinomycetota bacterium]|nr:aldehyde dehydrogenase family protein [Actinomycetota bacterium]